MTQCTVQLVRQRSPTPMTRAQCSACARITPPLTRATAATAQSRGSKVAATTPASPAGGKLSWNEPVPLVMTLYQADGQPWDEKARPHGSFTAPPRMSWHQLSADTARGRTEL